jgi:hypothetical protein
MPMDFCYPKMERGSLENPKFRSVFGRPLAALLLQVVAHCPATNRFKIKNVDRYNVKLIGLIETLH